MLRQQRHWQALTPLRSELGFGSITFATITFNNAVMFFFEPVVMFCDAAHCAFAPLHCADFVACVL